MLVLVFTVCALLCAPFVHCVVRCNCVLCTVAKNPRNREKNTSNKSKPVYPATVCVKLSTKKAAESRKKRSNKTIRSVFASNCVQKTRGAPVRRSFGAGLELVYVLDWSRRCAFFVIPRVFCTQSDRILLLLAFFRDSAAFLCSI